MEKLWEPGDNGKAAIDTYSKEMKSTLAPNATRLKPTSKASATWTACPASCSSSIPAANTSPSRRTHKLGVKTIALIDTDSDPDLIDLPIPGNDDAMRAIEMILKDLADAVIDGKTGRGEVKGEEPQQPRRRSTRAAFRARRRRGGNPGPRATTRPPVAENVLPPENVLPAVQPA